MFDEYKKSLLTLIFSSLALVVSLAWNDAIKTLIKTHLNVNPLVYPFVVTILYLYLGKYVEKLKK